MSLESNLIPIVDVWEPEAEIDCNSRRNAQIILTPLRRMPIQYAENISSEQKIKILSFLEDYFIYGLKQTCNDCQSESYVQSSGQDFCYVLKK